MTAGAETSAPCGLSYPTVRVVCTLGSIAYLQPCSALSVWPVDDESRGVDLKQDACPVHVHGLWGNRERRRTPDSLNANRFPYSIHVYGL